MTDEELQQHPYYLPPDYDQGMEYERTIEEYRNNEKKGAPYLINQYLRVGDFGYTYYPELYKFLNHIPVDEADLDLQFHIAGLIRKLPISIDTAILDVKNCSIPQLRINFLVPLITITGVLHQNHGTLGSPIIDLSLLNIQNMMKEAYLIALKLWEQENIDGENTEPDSGNKRNKKRRHRPDPSFQELFTKRYQHEDHITALKKALMDHKYITSQNQWVGLNKTKNELSTIIHYLKEEGVISLTVTPAVLKVFHAEFGLELSPGDRKRPGDYANMKSLGKDNMDATTYKKAKEIFKDYLSKK